ncbi:phosphodiesterase/alkaline phosphatase D precursor [Saitoella complicata NRRL Y-17804]|uniref:PhoD-like phosphatase metallophosphatase domain-containing protein n=1 Tax=Saitoella complicata (strain BCRC 22490 / CBS 7301 / JCM 7358 / NBRC 10748 / NRRL Y-17804) TaxID=698492 RepID=A0A0E9N8U0_SAICN|nr:phosphodiesterase/alkaline phosphatase D precursor [Saitoella complicata NRRL Y-17804]ODQ53182.1 phosphodiesterase/alkaline phosphatase D precursor [Saitoella complicata NRRL Y-17804]GAO46312.1 hypothetical protein G7K_0544-t1 [Saitoella complicata NRRL Y-17804]
MRFTTTFAVAPLLLASTVLASFDGNLNYKSPSKRHPWLGIDQPKVVKRATTDHHDASALNFTHGVASGDPYSDSVVLWTRVAPTFQASNSNATVSDTQPLYYHGNISSTNPICVNYKVTEAKDVSGDVIAEGTAYTTSDVDYTVKVIAEGLDAFTTYYYQFSVCDSNKTSPIGRTKTLPNADDDIDGSVGLAVYSCSNYPFGFFNAYGGPVRKDSVDYVLHLGDYIYEYNEGDYGWGYSIDRTPLPNKGSGFEITSLYDYRTRIAQYRTDQDLADSHRYFPWIQVWDDHEVADNTWKAGASYMNNTEDSFIQFGNVSFDQRKANAVRAYFEWMPLRQVDMDDNLRIWRDFSIGSLLDLVMLDTRQYDRDITDLYWNTDYVHAISDEQSRSLMGSRQENWFYKKLSESQERGAAWRVIGNQIVFSRLNESVAYGSENPLNYDAWDGYLANKNRTLKHLYENEINNTIFLAGDSHANWVSDLVWLDEHSYDPSTGAGSIGVEFAGTAVTSPSPFGANITIGAANNISTALVDANRELQWSETFYRGYYELHLNYSTATAQYYGYPDIKTRNGHEISLANFTVYADENKLARNPKVAGGVANDGYLRGGKITQLSK